jgi:hypothetical protein
MISRKISGSQIIYVNEDRKAIIPRVRLLQLALIIILAFHNI